MKNKPQPSLIPSRLYQPLRLVTTAVLCTLWVVVGPLDLVWLRPALPAWGITLCRCALVVLWLDGLVSVSLHVWARLRGPEQDTNTTQS